MKLTKLEVHAILMGVSEFTFANVMIKNTGRIHKFPSIRSSPNIMVKCHVWVILRLLAACRTEETFVLDSETLPILESPTANDRCDGSHAPSCIEELEADTPNSQSISALGSS
jgi:hypothetical protein